MRFIFLILFCLFFIFTSNAQLRHGKCGQNNNSDYCPNNTILHETNGNIIQLNYNTIKLDHIIDCSATNMKSITFGLTYFAFSKVRAAGTPFEFNIMFGIGDATFETGLGIQYLYFYRNYEKTKGEYDDNTSYLAATGRLGLRVQKDRGFFFRIGFTPIYSLMNHDKISVLGKHKFKPMAGIGFGYTFPKYTND